MIIFRTLLFIITFSVTLACVAYSATSAIKLTNLSVKQGLSQGSINDILQDSEGFIWIATESGLNLYDGYKFRLLPGTNGELKTESAYQIVEAPNKDIWINFYTTGIVAFNKKLNTYQPILATDPNNEDFYVVDFKFQDTDTVWIATTKTLLKYTLSSQTTEVIADLSAQLEKNNRINNTSYHNGIIYMATRIGVFALDTQTHKWRQLPQIGSEGYEITNALPELANRTYNLHVALNQKLYIGSDQGVYAINVGNIAHFINKSDKLSPYQEIVKDLSSWRFHADNNYLYVSSSAGLSRINTDTEKTEYLFGFSDSFDNLNDNTITAIFKDNSGVFWLGSSSTGIYQWDPSFSLFQHFTYKRGSSSSLSDNVVWTIDQSNVVKNSIWVGTSNGINLVNLETAQIQQMLVEKNKKNIYTRSYIYKLKEDNQGRLWVSTPEGLNAYSVLPFEQVTFNFPDEALQQISAEQISFIVHEDTLWSLTEDKLATINLVSGQLNTLEKVNQHFANTPLASILGFLPASDKLLLATNSELWSYDINSTQLEKVYQHLDVRKDDFTYFDSWTYDERQHIIWIALSTKGLIGLDATSYERKHFLSSKDARLDPNLYGVILDKEGDVWMSSHNGIFLLNSATLHLRNFSLNDGINALEYNGGAFKQLDDGRIIYGSINGIDIFDPLALKSKNKKDKLSITTTNLSVLSRKLDLPFMLHKAGNIKLKYDDVGIRFDFSPLLYSNHNNLYYSFRLRGAQVVTYPETQENYIIFPTLPSGESTLEVRVKSPFSGYYSDTHTINISVSYPPWASPIAYFVYAVVAISILLIIFLKRRAYTRMLIANHNEVKYREQRLSLALKGSNSDVWDWQATNNVFFGKRAAVDLGYKNLSDSYSFDKHLELIHINDQEAYYHQWQQFLLSADINESFSCTYRLRAASGEWLWYKDLGKIVALDKDGKPLRVTGSYTNITQTRAESEVAQYYGDAFKQTKDWVLIISENFRRVMVNDSLQQAFGWQKSEVSFDVRFLGLKRKKLKFYRKLFNSLKEGENWRGEELIKAKSGEEYHVIVSINASKNKTTKTMHYVCIATDITAQKAAEEELRYLANYDHLTDLPNRTLLLERVKHAMDSARRHNISIALFFIDLDKFKQVNDSLGHDYGDLLLQKVTKRIRGSLRLDDTLARLGGDEFVVLLESYKQNNDLTKIAQKIIARVGETIQLNENSVSIGASIGIAIFPDDATNCNDLLKNADVAMYHAKQLGRNTFQFFTPQMNVEADERLHSETKVKLAVKNEEFVNYYQPIVDSRTGKAIGVELLMRWNSEGKIVTPDKFITIAEELNLITLLTEQAFYRAAHDIAQWLKLRPGIFVSVNIAAQHFSNPKILEFLSTLLHDYNLPATAIKLEITENTLIGQPEQVIEQIAALADIGIKTALDDFGTGYSSLNYLKRLPLNILKIDRSFISGIGVDSADEAIIDATLVLAKNLSMTCVAEGVENSQQLNYLGERHCFSIQGYLYSKPVPAADITKMLVENKVELNINNP